MWAARFFKTRALAAEACEAGRIEANGQRAKASREVRPGTMLRVKSEAGEFHVEILMVSEARGPAAVAQTMYRETDESRELRVKVAAERKAMMESGEVTVGRPNRRDRQALSRMRGRIHPF